MTKISVHFSSNTDDWATPQDFFDRIDCKIQFDIDVCANAENAKCTRYFDEAMDGLVQEWRGKCWMNPPYGRSIIQWMKKAYESNTCVACLIPARTDTGWWHEYAMRAKTIVLLRGRIKFGGHKNSAPFPSALVIFEPRAANDNHPPTFIAGMDAWEARDASAEYEFQVTFRVSKFSS